MTALEGLVDDVLMLLHDGCEPASVLDELCHVEMAFGGRGQALARRLYEARVELVMRLAPAEALRSRVGRSISRRKLVLDWLVSRYEFSDGHTVLLANSVSAVIDRLLVRRKDVTRHREVLRAQQRNKCAHCRQLFVEDVSRAVRDPWKPYCWDGSLLEPQVDHVQAVSLLGDNRLENLQLLCRLCNSGKGAGLGVSYLQFKDGAASEVEREVVSASVRHFLASLVYYVIDRDGRQCVRGAAHGGPLTVRPVDQSAPLFLGNVQSLCYDCVGAR